jgi:LmbE family N-acetylglucosaminyl deacetylase
MHALQLLNAANIRVRLLCIGAHADDIEIGCGGTILQLIVKCSAVEVDWVVFGARGARAREARESARLFLRGVRRSRVLVKQFRDGFFPYQGARIKTVFESLKRQTPPDIVFTHYRDDRHQDHRLLSDLTWNTFRDHSILEYEIPKYDGDLGTPNCFVPLTSETSDRKIKYLMTTFASQRNKPWFSEETFRGLMRLRGMESRAPAGHAEAFYGRKVLLEF